jgi:hypothetical protein
MPINSLCQINLERWIKSYYEYICFTLIKKDALFSTYEGKVIWFAGFKKVKPFYAKIWT